MRQFLCFVGEMSVGKMFFGQKTWNYIHRLIDRPTKASLVEGTFTEGRILSTVDLLAMIAFCKKKRIFSMKRVTDLN
jgi:hypothetical protein